jgi:hypothetical protein
MLRIAVLSLEKGLLDSFYLVDPAMKCARWKDAAGPKWVVFQMLPPVGLVVPFWWFS